MVTANATAKKENAMAYPTGMTRKALEHLQTIPAEILAAVARGEIDLNKVARTELALRGLDWSAKWVGFPEAERISNLIPVRGAKGKMIAVSVPE